MSPLVQFLQPLFERGEVSFRGKPIASSQDRREAKQWLHAAYAEYRLRVAGPLLEFDAAAALAAADVVRHACWFLVSRSELESELEDCLRIEVTAATPEQHLSADLVLRYLPQVHGRARATAAADRLTVLLADLLRRWPLSGVLADVAEEPLTPLDFGGHAGLMLLYAERLVQNDKPAWVPQGRCFEFVDLVYGGLHKKPPRPWTKNEG